MATLFGVDPSLGASKSNQCPEQDPFVSQTTTSNHYRFSHFNHQAFALSPTTSLGQTKRVLEAHLAETERRIHDTSELGNKLLQQRKELTGWLETTEKQRVEDNIPPDLRLKLVEIEKEYNEVGRESARALLSKPRITTNGIFGSELNGDYQDKLSASPFKDRFESQGTGSPSKLNVINRRQRNQPTNRVHDIEFVTEISTSLLSQVRNLQALLAEKEEYLKDVMSEKSRLELEIESITERFRGLSESGERYKDENWSLETQIHEYIAKDKEAADRERKLTQNLKISEAEKSAAQKELDEIKSNFSKLSDEHSAAFKHYDVELGNSKRTLTLLEAERDGLQRKVEELLNQNKELVKAIANYRGRTENFDESRLIGTQDYENELDDITPDHSPPQSPVKGTPRHSMLESETLKSSLQHAHRMIQNLKSNIHREKSEKLELKRLLQDTRDELELRRGEISSTGGKKSRKVEQKEPKKNFKIGQLGVLRNVTSEIHIDDLGWEDYDGDNQRNLYPSRSESTAVTSNRLIGSNPRSVESSIYKPIGSSDHFGKESEEEANEAYETVDERPRVKNEHQFSREATVEDLTETEGESGLKVLSKENYTSLSIPGYRHSFQSNASTSDGEFDNGSEESRALNSVQTSRFRLKINRGSYRRSRIPSEEPRSYGSPSTITNTSRDGTPQPTGQSLFAELGEISGSDEESVLGTPSHSKNHSRSTSRISNLSTTKSSYASLPLLPKLPMTDSSMMTEPCELDLPRDQTSTEHTVNSELMKSPAIKHSSLISTDQTSVATQTESKSSMIHASSQWYENSPLGKEIGSQSALPPTQNYFTSPSDPGPDNKDGELASSFKPLKLDFISTNKLESIQLSQNLHTSVSTKAYDQLEPYNYIDKSIQTQEKSGQAKTSRVSESLVFSEIQYLAIEPKESSSVQTVATIISSEANDKKVKPRDYDSQLSMGLESELVDPANANSILRSEDKSHESTEDPSHTKSENSLSPSQDQVKSGYSTLSSKELKTIDESSQTALTKDDIEEMVRKIQMTSPTDEDTNTSLSTRVPRSLCKKSFRSRENFVSIDQAKTNTVTPNFAHIANSLKVTDNSYRRSNSTSKVRPPSIIEEIQNPVATTKRKNSFSIPRGISPHQLPSNSTQRPGSPNRPMTPNIHVPSSPSLKDGTTPRPIHSFGSAAAHLASRNMRSRVSSTSSFASEVDNRFQMHNNIGVSVILKPGIQSGTDPRMINAITQTMIGEYLWKYTRKTGRGAMSENRHRRYFWVHPYTRTLYWSNRDPAVAGRSELKAKSVPIEAVRVVTDDNPMPPGLHRKSLVIVTPSRAVKFTATTGQRHETWFNSLSYLLLRTGEETVEDKPRTLNGSITYEDVAEFDPGRSSGCGGIMTSLPIRNSHLKRNESPGKNISMTGSRSSQPSNGTFSRLSSYWKPNREGLVGSTSSRQSKYSTENFESTCDLSDVHDSAEDLREIIERQDRESDRLENVRACCDGRHDVGHLHNSTKSRHTKNLGFLSTSSRVDGGGVRFDPRTK
ncbi:Anucleate primary sterigmata protein A [Golovinomyces cichoracearum]|uniref:Anucleate primary sterigmata protein A n=1 Tax=Golovinomyces cichoracearum TaxID=62708 RepID=A0A420IDU7_9PEZI|nr:Anucleate primary sterigmata protein A [Golovinomyces cichoracearum]